MLPLDLHVLSPPLAFALSQDQTLQFNLFVTALHRILLMQSALCAVETLWNRTETVTCFSKIGSGTCPPEANTIPIGRRNLWARGPRKRLLSLNLLRIVEAALAPSASDSPPTFMCVVEGCQESFLAMSDDSASVILAAVWFSHSPQHL